jgi:hypothetical protein
VVTQVSKKHETWGTLYYFIGENSVGCMYVTSTFSTVFSACSDFTTSWNPGSDRIASQFLFASSRLE